MKKEKTREARQTNQEIQDLQAKLPSAFVNIILFANNQLQFYKIRNYHYVIDKNSRRKVDARSVKSSHPSLWRNRDS